MESLIDTSNDGRGRRSHRLSRRIGRKPRRRSTKHRTIALGPLPPNGPPTKLQRAIDSLLAADLDAYHRAYGGDELIEGDLLAGLFGPTGPGPVRGTERRQLNDWRSGFAWMSRTKPPLAERRVLSAADTAAYLGRSASWLAEHAERLYGSGFPRPIPIVGGYDKQAIDRWLERLGGNAEPGNHHAAWMNAIHD